MAKKRKSKSNRGLQRVRQAPPSGSKLIMQRVLGIVLLCFILVILGFFAVSFFSGSHNATAGQRPSTAIAPAKRDPSSVAVKPKYDFYNDLAKRRDEVQVELDKKIKAVQNVKVNGKNYRIQIGAFQDKASADRLRARMILRDYPVQIVNNGSLYLVQVGPYIKREEAEAIQKRIQREGIKDVVMKAYVN